jgi:hypothetical protein
MKDLEEHYRNLLDNPSPGDLEDLEQKFLKKAAQLRNIKENEELHLSAIQQNGEVVAAYQYLKTLWSMKFKNSKNQFLTKDKNENQNNLSVVEKTYLKLKLLTKGAIIALGFTTIIHLAPIFSDSLFFIPEIESQEVVLAKAIEEEAKLRSFRLTRSSQNKSSYLKNIPAEFGSQPELIKAARSCNVHRMKQAIEDGESPNIINQKGETGLHWAVKRNCIDGVIFLLSQGASIHIKDGSGRTPVDLAESSYHSKILGLFKSAST